MKYNRQCKYNDKDIAQVLKKCAKNNEIMSIPDLIGEGTYGKVYLVEVLNGNKEIKVAVKKITISLDDEDSLKSIENEIKYSIQMAKANIGPKIYDAFYTEDSNEYNQYIIMEYFKYDGEKFFRNKSISLDTKKEAYRKMMELVNIQIHKNMYCIDIKPSNFLVDNENGIKVRMIDFGGDYCSTVAKKLVEEEYTKYIYTIDLLQLYVLTAFDVSNNYKDDSITSVTIEDEYFTNLIKNRKGVQKYYSIGEEHYNNKGPLDQHYFLYYYTKFMLGKGKEKTITIDEIMNKLYKRINEDIKIYNDNRIGGYAIGSIDTDSSDSDLDSDSSDSLDSSSTSSLSSYSSDSSDSELDYDL